MPRATRPNGKPCRNCPHPPTVKPAVKLSATEGESQYLWNHVLFGTTTCANMILGYARNGLKGDPTVRIRHIIGILENAVSSVRSNNAPPIAAKVEPVRPNQTED